MIDSSVEVPKIMLLPAVIQVSFILAIGLMPSFFGVSVISIVQQLLNEPSSDFTASAIQSLTVVGHVNMLLIGLIVVIMLLKTWQQSKVKLASGPTWGCGYTAGDFRHQYTPTSYADSLRELANPVIDYKKVYTSFPEKEIFPQPKEFHTESKDLVEEKTVLSWVHLIVNHLPKAGIAQSGLINDYLVYPMLFLILVGLLIALNIL